MSHRYRIKTPEELLSSGFARTPRGDYVRPMSHSITDEMIEYAKGFSDDLCATFFASHPFGASHSNFIDGRTYATEHFVQERPTKGVQSV